MVAKRRRQTLSREKSDILEVYDEMEIFFL